MTHVINADWFVKRWGVRKGGEMLNEWNRLSFQIASAVFAGFGS